MSKPESSVSSIVQQLSKGDEDVPPKIRLNLLNELVQISDQIESYDTDALLCCLRATLLGSLRTLRVAALRVIRYYLKNSEFTVHLISLGVNLFISRSLDKIDKQTEVERLQVLKLVRKWVVTCCETIPNNIVHSLVSLGEAAEDPLQRISVEVVCEITMRNPKVSANCGGIKLLLNAILDPNNVGIQESLVQGLAYLLNGSNRKFVRIPLDLGILLAPITECQIKETPPAPPPAPAAGAANNAPNNLAGNAQNKPQLTITNPTGQTSTAPKKEKKEDKVSMSIRAISILLRGWTGVFVLSSFPFGLASLVNAFYLPSHDLHVQVLDALFDIFRISDVDKNSDPSGTKLGSSAEEDHSFRSIGLLELPKKARGKQQNLLNNYLSVLLVAFIHCGLIEGLVTLGTKYSKNSEAGGQSTVTKATLLLGELLYLTNVLLPPNQCAKVQTLPKLVEFAASFTVLDPRQRSRASTMLSNLHSYHHQKHSNNNTAETSGATNDWKRLKLGDRRHERKIDSLKKLDAQLDQDQLRTKILESQVTTTKDHTKWKWDNISDLIDGPLLSNPTLLTQVMKTKFIKRVLSYFRPLTQAFAALPWTPENDKYRRIAVQLLQVLVSTEQGADYLKHSKLIPEIIDIIKLELDPVANAHPAHKERPLSSEKMWKKMSAEYFTILGSLSTTPRGMEILIDFGILDYLTALVALPSRDDLFATIVTSLDYTTSDHTRMFLSKALSSSSKGTRFRATRHLHVLVRSGVQNFDQWGITFLLDQLNDGDIKASKMALNALTEACNQVECMDALIAAKPQLLKHGPAGKHLWLRSLSRPNGLANLLAEGNQIHTEMNLWKKELNDSYVLSIEHELNQVFSPSSSLTATKEQELDGVTPPPHFYGELAKTEKGCQVLEESRHVNEFIQCASELTTQTQLQRRAALWALGHIGSSQTGLSFLLQSRYHIQNMDVLQVLTNLATNDPCLSIRGTCMYILGMMSGVEDARRRLDWLGWESPTNLSSLICVPKDHKSELLFRLHDDKYCGSYAVSGHISYFDKEDETNNEILTNVTHLSNSISADSASRTLKRLKAQHTLAFSSPRVALEAYKLMGVYKYKLAARRFIYELFDGVAWASADLSLLTFPTFEEN